MPVAIMICSAFRIRSFQRVAKIIGDADPIANRKMKIFAAVKICNFLELAKFARVKAHIVQIMQWINTV